jgi:hypothetical protein
MADPWAFGWTQLLTIIGFIITVAIAIGGFGTFERWRKQKLEEKKIEVAVDALAITYKARFVFEHIRGPFVFSSEWADMPERVGDTNDRRSSRGAYYAPLKRINQNKEFFEQLWKIQPLAMAVFGRRVEEIFLKVHQARRNIEVAAQMLMESVDDPFRGEDKENIELYKQLRVDIVGHGGQYTKEGDRVGVLLRNFEAGMEAIFRPVIDREYPRLEVPKTKMGEIAPKLPIAVV